MKRQLILTTTAAALLAGTTCVSAEPEKIDLAAIGADKWPLVDAGTAPMLDGLRNADAIPAPASGGYGFSADVTPEKGSFRLGVLMADLQVAANAGDAERTVRAASALLDGLVALEASDALVTAATQLVIALNTGTSTDAVARLGRPLLEPHIRAFVNDEGSTDYYALGDWSETLLLMLSARNDDASEPVAFAKQAQRFAERIGGNAEMPQGVQDALSVLADLGATEQPSARQIERGKQAIATLNSVLG